MVPCPPVCHKAWRAPPDPPGFPPSRERRVGVARFRRPFRRPLHNSSSPRRRGPRRVLRQASFDRLPPRRTLSRTNESHCTTSAAGQLCKGLLRRGPRSSFDGLPLTGFLRQAPATADFEQDERITLHDIRNEAVMRRAPQAGTLESPSTGFLRQAQSLPRT